VNPIVVLLVEDDECVRFCVLKLLEVSGFRVLTADDGISALEASRNYSGRIDLLLSDVDMPRMDGVELCRILASERPETKVVLMSGGMWGRDLPRVPLLCKPFTITALQDCIERSLSTSWQEFGCVFRPTPLTDGALTGAARVSKL
jgi:CheY-like chemotaxis protein